MIREELKLVEGQEISLEEVISKYEDLQDIYSEYSHVISKVNEVGINNGEPIEVLMENRDKISAEIRELLSTTMVVIVKPELDIDELLSK